MAVTVDIGENRSETIVVFEGETGNQVAKAFAQKHGLNEVTEKMLAG